MTFHTKFRTRLQNSISILCFKVNGPSPYAPNGSSTKGGPDDLLMTPILPSPMTSDLWSTKTTSSSSVPNENQMQNLVLHSSESVVISESPQDLPMDSDIGLRSPCAGKKKH